MFKPQTRQVVAAWVKARAIEYHTVIIGRLST